MSEHEHKQQSITVTVKVPLYENNCDEDCGYCRLEFGETPHCVLFDKELSGGDSTLKCQECIDAVDKAMKE